ncbi:MAG: hypothetical protein FJ139_00395 [Deltaproteobacteria bacterium]|nr:hypothetical protein [Deltaproteobacteria bacterium]
MRDICASPVPVPRVLRCPKATVAMKMIRVIRKYDEMACLEITDELTGDSRITLRNPRTQKKSTIPFKEPIKYGFFLLHQFIKQLSGFDVRDFFVESMQFGRHRDFYKGQHLGYEFFGFAG